MNRYLGLQSFATPYLQAKTVISKLFGQVFDFIAINPSPLTMVKA